MRKKAISRHPPAGLSAEQAGGSVVRLIVSLFFCLFILLYSLPLNFNPVLAVSPNTNCSNRFATLVNPVRSRNLWVDKSLKPIENQYSLIKTNQYPATWLIQYDVLQDADLVNKIKSFDKSQEIGVFLEVTQTLGDAAKVIYPYNTPWFSPEAVFLSGYDQSDRKKLIDKLFSDFKKEFGFYPKSVGAWWIDSYSLEYLKSHFRVGVAMIVADQKTTDNYGVWGQWWGMPYYPSKANILTPASSIVDKQKVAIIQWAQRDPLRAYGEGPQISNFSLQANDYIRQGKDTEYFKQIAASYLDCQNSLGQITVGLETGQESTGYIGEYGNQLRALKTFPNLSVVTMSNFGKSYAKVYPHIPPPQKISFEGSTWELSSRVRVNSRLGDYKEYEAGISFADYFVADNSNFLNRVLPDRSELKYQPNLNFLFLAIIFGLGILSIRIKKINVWVSSLLFTVATFGLVLRSGLQFGWQVFYGPVISDLSLWKIFIVLTIFLLFFAISHLNFLKAKIRMLWLWLIPLSYGLDFITRALRYSVISENQYFGIAINDLRFIGISISPNRHIGFLNQEFPAYQAAALLRFDYAKIWDNLWLTFLVYPLVHLLVGLILAFVLVELPKKLRIFVLGFLGVLMVSYMFYIFQADPRVVMPESFMLRI